MAVCLLQQTEGRNLAGDPISGMKPGKKLFPRKKMGRVDGRRILLTAAPTFVCKRRNDDRGGRADLPCSACMAKRGFMAKYVEP